MKRHRPRQLSNAQLVALMQRDHEQCRACKKTRGEAKGLHPYRIVPDAKFEATLSNYVVLCEECHQRASAGEAS